MPLAALICATAPSVDPGHGPRGQLAFAGASLLEYQARQARDAGASQLLIMVDAVTPTLSRAVDALHADGLKVHLIRDMASLVREAPRDADVLLFADGAIVDQRHIDGLAKAEGAALLVAEDGSTTAHFERIDGVHRWVGVARLSPDMLFGTLDLIGDWDVPSTLMRAAVQQGARRVAVPENEIVEGRVALVDRQAAADVVALALLAPARNGAAGSGSAGAEHYLLRPLAGLIAGQVVRMQLPPLRLRLIAGALALLGLALLYPGWRLAALLLFLAALIGNLAADRCAAMARRGGEDGWMAPAPVALAMAGVALSGLGIGTGAAAYAALAALLIDLAVRRGRTGSAPPWACVTPGTLCLWLIVGALIGLLPAAMALGALAGIGSLGALLLAGEGRR